MSIDNIADYGYNWLSKELSDKVNHILAVLHLLPTSKVFHTPIMVKHGLMLGLYLFIAYLCR